MPARIDAAQPDVSAHGPEGTIVICGLGTLGARLVELLAPDHPVIIISRDFDARLRRVTALPNVQLVEADFLEHETLERVGLQQARALLAVSADDFNNLAVAMLARQLCATLPVVIRRTDPIQAAALGRHVPNAIGLSVPALAAPTFGLAAYRAGRGPSHVLDQLREVFLVGNHPWLAISDALPARDNAVAGPHSPRAETGRFTSVADLERRRGVTVVACSTVGDTSTAGQVELLPPPERRLTASEQLIVVGPWERVAAESPRPDQSVAHRWGEMWDGFLARLGRIRQELWAVLAMLMVTVGLNTAIFTIGYGLTPLDALYFVVSTITTVGYGDITLRAAPAPLKLYGVVLMLVGVLLMAAIYAVVTDYLVGSRLDDLLGARPIPRRDHVVIAGLGTVGFRTAQMLRAMGEHVVAVDADVAHPTAGQARRAGIPVVVGDATAGETLARAHIAGARCLVAATSDDHTNLAIALTARDAAQRLAIVLRVFETGLVKPVQATLGIDDVLSAAEPAAHAFALAARLGLAYRAAIAGPNGAAIHVVDVTVPTAITGAPAVVAWLGRRAGNEPIRILLDGAVPMLRGTRRKPPRGETFPPGKERTVTVATTVSGARRLLKGFADPA